MALRKRVDEVFTPRSSQVNNEMYIHRESLEKNLFRSINGSMHSFLFGESGNGKSWLYKKVFKDNKINYVVANCANASRKKSILEEIYSLSVSVGSSVRTGYNETKKAEVSALVAKGELSHEDQYSVQQEDKLITAFSNFNSQSKDSKFVIVLDNVETIFKNNSLMSELSDIIILLDDERYEKYNIKILIVGVPNGVMQYFSAAKNPASVGNRIEEIRRVAGLSSTQTRDLVKHGLTIQLKIDISPGQMKDLAKHVFSITLGVPQRIHEYCDA